MWNLSNSYNHGNAYLKLVRETAYQSLLGRGTGQRDSDRREIQCNLSDEVVEGKFISEEGKQRLFKMFNKVYYTNPSEERGVNMWIIPAIIGQRVILNPEGHNYDEYNRKQSKGNAGYITSVDEDEIGCWARKTKDSIKRISARVKWDNGHENGYRLNDLLPVETEHKTFIHVEFRDATERYATEDKLEEIMDQKVIKEGTNIYRKHEYGKEYRDRIFTKVAEDYKRLTRTNELSPYHTQVMQELSRLGYGGTSATETSTEENVISQLLGELPFES